MATERLDAIVVGANIEGLFAAAALARAGRYVAVFDAKVETELATDGQDCFVELGAVAELDLVSHGLRLSGPSPIIGVASEHALILWPELQSSQTSITAVSSRDADAYAGFCARIGRAAALQGLARDGSLSNWHLSSGTNGEASKESVFLRSCSLERLLNEEFTNDLLKGMLAQGALIGTGASQRMPGSAFLLTRQSLLSVFGFENSCRFVAGGEAQLKRALLTLLKFYNTVDVHYGRGVKEIAVEKDIVQAVSLIDGATVRAPVVISAVGFDATDVLLRNGNRGRLTRSAMLPPALVRFTTSAAPVVRGLNAATVSSNATIRLNPSLSRLARAHSAFHTRHLLHDYCLELKVRPRTNEGGALVWDVYVTVMYVPSATDEGPWTGNRRERFVAACAKTIEEWVPGFGASLVGATLIQPAEAQSFVEAEGPVPLGWQQIRDSSAIPEARAVDVSKVLKGLLTIEPSLFSGQGSGGLLAAQASGLSKRVKAASDA